ncbi:MAG: beta-galactosidase [Candidatus Saganbacteria bacterium]|nr:beta-galactosidase [Candidatus Saganbacteria bacterium]
MQNPFGVTFYPELWSKNEVKEAFVLIKKSGFNIIRFGEISWGEVEPKDGKFDFRAFDEAFKIAQKLGLKILLGLGVSQAPQWLIAKHPEFKQVSSCGFTHPEYGPRPNVCRDNPRFLKYAKRYVEKVLKRYAKHPALAMWQIDNEPNYPPLDLTNNCLDFCHCPATRKAFIDWLRERYKTIDKLNQAMGTSFWGNRLGNFADIATPKGGFWDAGNPHFYLEWMRFKSEQLSKWLCWLKGLVRKYDKEHPVGTNNFVGICCRTPDHLKLARGMDYYGWDVYPKGTRNSPESLAEHADHWRGICEANNAAFILSELQGGRNVRWGYPGWVKGEEIYTWSHQVAAHGAKGILYHALRPPLFGSETGGFGILGADGGETDRLQEIVKAGKELKQVWPIIKDAKLKAEIAIVYLKSAEIQTYQEEGPVRSVPAGWVGGRGDIGLMYGLDSIAGAYRVLWDWDLPGEFLFEDNLAKELPSYKAILLPNPYLLDTKTAQALMQFVKNGGSLITEARFGMKDELGHLRPQPFLQNFFSVRYIGTEVIEGEKTLKKLGGKITGFRDLIETKEEVAGYFEDGKPALILKKVGKGTIVYATFSLFANLLKYENLNIVRWLRKHLPEPFYKLKASEEVEIVPWEDKDLFFYAINHADKEEKVKITLQNKVKKAEDLLGKSDCVVLQGTIQFSLMPRGVKLIKVHQ